MFLYGSTETMLVLCGQVSPCRVILQSSTPLAQWPINENPRQGFDALANQTGCLDSMDSRPGLISYTPEAQKRAQIKKALACLRRLDAAELIRFSAEQEVSLFDSFIWVSEGPIKQVSNTDKPKNNQTNNTQASEHSLPNDCVMCKMCWWASSCLSPLTFSLHAG